MPNSINKFYNLNKTSLYKLFNPKLFNDLSYVEKHDVVSALIHKLCQEKQLIPPLITFINDQSENFGSYNSIRNTLNINLDYILDLQLDYEQKQKFKSSKDKDKQEQNLDTKDLVGKYPSFELLNVIFHELRHYEQKEKVKDRDIQKGIKYPLPSSHIHYILQPHEQDAYETAHKTLEGILVLDLKDYLLQTITNYNKSVKHAKYEKAQLFNLIDNIKDFFINKYTNNYYPEQSVSKANIKQIFNVIDNVPKEFNIDIVKNNEFIDAIISDSNNKIRLFVKNEKASILLEDFKNKDTINDVIIAAKNFVDLYNLHSNTKVSNIEIIPYSLENSIIKTSSAINKINKNLLVINENNVNMQKLNEINQNILKSLINFTYEGKGFKIANLLNYSLESLIDEINQIEKKYELIIEDKKELLEKLSERLDNNQSEYLNQHYEVQINEPIQLLLDAGIISEITTQQTQQKQQENLDHVINNARNDMEQNIILDNQNIDEQNR